MFFYLAQEGKIFEGNIFWLSGLNLKDIPYKIDSPEPWTELMLNMFCPRVHKIVASFVQKVGLIWPAKRWHFTSVIQDAKVIVNHWDKPDDGVMCAGKENKAGLKLVQMKTGVATPTCKLLLRKKNEHWVINIVLF